MKSNKTAAVKRPVKRTTKSINPSTDSGLTIPITKDISRPWFSSV